MLEQELVEDLLKSGFASELRVLEAFKAKKWTCFADAQVSDEDTNSTRSIDFHCTFGRYLGSPTRPNVTIIIEAWVEVKKTEKPWVVLRSAAHDDFGFRVLASGNLLHTNKFADPSNFASILRSESIAVRNNWIGHGIHESFKKPNAPSRWFPACKKIADVCLDPRYSAVFGARPNEGFEIIVTRPLIVLDGPLFAVAMSSEGLRLEHIHEAAINFQSMHPKRVPRMLLIDIVSVAALENYLEREAGTFERLADEASIQS